MKCLYRVLVLVVVVALLPGVVRAQGVVEPPAETKVLGRLVGTWKFTSTNGLSRVVEREWILGGHIVHSKVTNHDGRPSNHKMYAYDAKMKAYQSEAGLAKKVDSMKKAQPDAPDFAKTVLEAAQAGEATLELMKTMADKNANVAGKMKQLANRRVGLVQARNKLLSEDRIRRAANAMAQ